MPSLPGEKGADMEVLHAIHYAMTGVGGAVPVAACSIIGSICLCGTSDKGAMYLPMYKSGV